MKTEPSKEWHIILHFLITYDTVLWNNHICAVLDSQTGWKCPKTKWHKLTWTLQTMRAIANNNFKTIFVCIYMIHNLTGYLFLLWNLHNSDILLHCFSQRLITFCQSWKLYGFLGFPSKNFRLKIACLLPRLIYWQNIPFHRSAMQFDMGKCLQTHWNY